MTELRPAMVMVQAERVNVKEFVRTPDGRLAVDADALFRYLGDVTVEKVPGKDGTTVKRFFAWTVVDTSLGPFPNRVKAVEALLSFNGLRKADAKETSRPLWEDEPPRIGCNYCGEQLHDGEPHLCVSPEATPF